MCVKLASSSICSTTIHVESIGMQATIISSVCTRSDLTPLCYVHLHCVCVSVSVFSMSGSGLFPGLAVHVMSLCAGSCTGPDPFRYCASAPRCTFAVPMEKSLDTRDYCVTSLDSIPVFSCWAVSYHII